MTTSPYLHLDAAPCNDPVRVRAMCYPDSVVLHPQSLYWLAMSPHFVPWFVLFGYGYHEWGTIIRDARFEGAENPETFVWPFPPATITQEQPHE